MESRCDDGADDDADKSDLQLVREERMPVFSQHGTHVDQKYGPGDSADDGQDREFREGKLCDARRQGNEGTDPRKQTAGKDRNAAVGLKPVFGGDHFFRAHTAFLCVAKDHVAPALVAHVVGGQGADQPSQCADQDRRPEGEDTLRDEETRKAQNDLTGDGDIHVFERHTDKERKIAPFREKRYDEFHR